MNEFYIDDELFLKVKASHRLHKLLQKEGQVYKQAAHQRCGMGLTALQFDEIVQGATASLWCALKQGRNGAILLIFTQVFNDVKLPDEAERLMIPEGKQ